MIKQDGFTLIEVLVALAIAVTALMAMTGRLGASSDIQHALSTHALMTETAQDLIEAEHLTAGVSMHEKSGVRDVGNYSFNWRIWMEKTSIDGFVRQNVEVTTEGDEPVRLFLYRHTSR